MDHCNPGDPMPVLANTFATCPAAAQVFFGLHMPCPGCPIAPFHSVADTCREYGLDEAGFKAALLEVVATCPARQD